MYTDTRTQQNLQRLQDILSLSLTFSRDMTVTMTIALNEIAALTVYFK